VTLEDHMTESLYNCKTAAELTGRSPVTVRQLARTRGIGRRVGRDWVFTDADIARLKAIPGPGRPVSKSDPAQRDRQA
jgi:hypothetical protein